MGSKVVALGWVLAAGPRCDIEATTLEGAIANILVTAGPTHEHLDDVRYLANGSSGRMGYALAEAASAAGHAVVLVSGPTALAAPLGVDRRPVVSALEMQAAVARAMSEASAIDLVFAVAAVADYRPATRQPGKPKKSTSMTVELVPNPDILLELGQRKAAGEIDAVLVGFALEAGTPDEILDRGRAKLRRKHLDLVVVNHVTAMGATDNEVTLVFADGRQQPLPRAGKAEIAASILAAALDLLAGDGLHGDDRQGDS